jgi:hypothetical protein
LGGIQAGAAAVWGVMLLLLLPTGPGAWLLGPVWEPASKLLLPATVTIVNAGFAAGASAGLRALGAASRSLRAQGINSAAYLACGITGAVIAGAVGTTWGVAAATLIGTFAWWWQLHEGLREIDRSAAYATAGGRVDSTQGS